MFTKTVILILMFSFTAFAGCASVNKGAEKVGEAGGKVMKVPISASEGAAKGVAGEEESNPYKR